VARVEYFRDSNNNGLLDVGVDQLLATATNGAENYSTSLSTSGFPGGLVRILARAIDNNNLLEKPACRCCILQCGVGNVFLRLIATTFHKENGQ
jgi:hypothetical protein